MVGCGAIMDVASLIHWPIFLPINLLPSSYSSTHNTGRYHGPHVLGGGFPHPCFVSYVRATTQTAIHSQRLPIPEHKYGRPACTQVWEVHAITVDPVGINANNTGRYFLCTPGRGFLTETRSGLFVTIFHNTDRDYSCAYKINPTGTILVRENSTDRVSFVSFPPHFPPSARGRHPSFHASPTSRLHRLHFATLYISGTGSFSDPRMHTT